MCGIAGIVSRSQSLHRKCLREVTTRMASALAHRSPDDSGIWWNESANISLGHQRLSILDLSTTGRQPMMSRCKRFVVVFNGEIYNIRELKEELVARGHRFVGARTQKLSWRQFQNTASTLYSVCGTACLQSPSGIADIAGCISFAIVSASSHSIFS